MSEAIKTLIIGVLGSLLGSLLTLLVIYTYKQFVEIKSVRYYKSFWNFINKSVVIVQPVYIDSTGKDLPERFSHISDTIAIQCITNYLRDSKIEYNIIDHNQGIPENSDLILICGPKGNKKSKKFIDENKLPFSLTTEKSHQSAYRFIEKESGLEFYAPVDISDKKTDIGMIARYTDDNPKRKIFLFWGLHGPGTLATIRYSLKTDNLKYLHKKVGDNDFAMIVSASFRNLREIGEPQEYFRPILIKAIK